MDISVEQLVEKIENEGCLLKFTNVNGTYTIYHFLSKSGSTTDQILDDGEPMEKEVVLKHLSKLEVYYLSEQIYPKSA